jgi:hydroxymethylpyrimidine/phosphomethylpyrimidine kinase
LVTSVAAKHGFALKIFRVDPVLVAHHSKERLEDEAVNEAINQNLLDLTNVRAQQMSLDYAKCENLAHFSAIPKQTD